MVFSFAFCISYFPPLYCKVSCVCVFSLLTCFLYFYFLLQGVLCLCFSFFVFFISCFPLLYCKVSCISVFFFQGVLIVFLLRTPCACIAVCLAKPKCLLVSAGGSQAIASLTFPCQQLLTPQQSASFHFEIYHLLVFLAFSFLSVHFLVFFCQQAPNNSAVYWI